MLLVLLAKAKARLPRIVPSKLKMDDQLELDDTRGSPLTQLVMALAIDQSKLLKTAELDQKVDLHAAVW